MSAFQVLTETNAVSVAILNVKIAATVGLVADITRDLHALRLEFSIERISIVDPNVGVPRPALRINDMIGAHRSSCFELSQHDDDAVALDHTKRRGVVPEAFIMEAELVAVVVCGADYVIDDEVRGTAPALAVLHDVVAHCSFASHRLFRLCEEPTLPNGSRLSCGRLARRRKDGGRQSVLDQRHNTPLPYKAITARQLQALVRPHPDQRTQSASQHSSPKRPQACQ